MKHGLLMTVLLFLLTAAFAQQKNNEQADGKITGKVMDSSSNMPLEYATITLFVPEKAKPVNGTATDASGNFILAKISSGSYNIVIEFIGYQTLKLKNIIISQNRPAIDLKNIFLQKKTETLQAVTVTAQTKLVENKIDKMIFNAEKDITSQTGVATDILKKVPQISVDVDGNVELQGDANILFLIDGKPSTMLGSNITDVLQAIPANQIKSIEVITNPGAKYDAQGTGGIINIILKHNNFQGMNGNLSLTGGTLVQNGSFNINVRKGKFGMNAFASGNARLTTTTTTNLNRVSTDTATNTGAILQQDGSSNFNRHGFQSGIGFDWSPNDSNSFSGALSYRNFGNNSNGFVNQMEQTQIISGGAYSNINSINNINSSFKRYSFDPSLDYKHTFKNKDQQLEIVATGSFSNGRSSSGNDQYLQPQDSLFYGTRNNNPAKQSEYEIKADYTQPLHKDVNLGLGGKFSGYDISSGANALLWNPNAESYLYSSGLSNNLNYHQKVYAAYAELNFPVGKLLEARLGARYERTQVNAFYANAQQEIQNGYNTFVPSVFLMKKIGDNQTVKLNFTMRINRPDYRDLNPYINASDPTNISTGNPHLKPEIWDRYEASYNYDLNKIGSFMVTLFYRQSNGDIQSFVVYYPSINIGDTTYTNTSVTTRENIGIEKNMGANLFFNFNVNNKFSIRSNIIFMYRQTINQIDHGYNSSTTMYRFHANASYQFTDNFAAEFFGSFNSRHHEAQGYFPSFTSYSFALRKFLLKKKASIALTANNFFSEYVNQRTQLYGPGFTSNSLRQIPFRSIGINLTWKFGKLEMKKEKPEENQPDTNAGE